MDQFKDNIETRMVVYDQFFRRMEVKMDQLFRRQEAELQEVKKMQQTIAQLMRENEKLRKESKQFTLDVVDVDLHEKKGLGKGDYPSHVDHHSVPLSKEASNNWYASYPRPTSNKGRSSAMRPTSWVGGGGAKHDDPVRRKSD